MTAIMHVNGHAGLCPSTAGRREESGEREGGKEHKGKTYEPKPTPSSREAYGSSHSGIHADAGPLTLNLEGLDSWNNKTEQAPGEKCPLSF